MKKKIGFIIFLTIAGMALLAPLLSNMCQSFGLTISINCAKGIFAYKNEVDNPFIQWGSGWKYQKSEISGSEVNFSFTKNRSIIISADFSGRNSQQKLYINIGNATYNLSPGNKNQNTIIIPASEQTKNTHVRIWHSCALSTACGVKINTIYLQRGGTILQPMERKKTMVIFGDSNTLLYDENNYSFKLADRLGYILVKGAVFGSTVSPVKDLDYSFLRYREAISPYKPDVILVFLGTNDIGYDVSQNDFRYHYNRLLTGIRKTNPNAKIYTPGILKRKDKEVAPYNRIIAEAAKEVGALYLDTSLWMGDEDLMDEAHVSVLSQEKLANKFLEAIESQQ